MINIKIITTGRNWILKKLSQKILEAQPNDMNIKIVDTPSNKIEEINYYMGYQHFREKTKAIDIPFFTHPENNSFFEKAKRADYIIVMCKKYKKELVDKGVDKNKVFIIYPGVDDHFKPTLKILQPVKMSSDNRRKRKGYELWEKVKTLPYVECLCTEGEYTDKELFELYKNTDIILSTAEVEGGPMSVIEGLSLGMTVVAPRGVGFVDDFGGVITYEKSNFMDLKKVLDELYHKKLEIYNNVSMLTWENWAEKHYNLFRNAYKIRVSQNI